MLLKADGKSWSDFVTISSLTIVHGGVRHKSVEDVGEGGIVMVSASLPNAWDEGWVKDGAVLSYGTLVRRGEVEGEWRPGEEEFTKVNKVPARGTRAITFTVSPKLEADRKLFDRGIELLRLLEPGAAVNTTDRGEVTISVGGEVEMEVREIGSQKGSQKRSKKESQKGSQKGSQKRSKKESQKGS